MVTVRQSHSAEYHPGGTQSWLIALGLPEAKISALLDADSSPSTPAKTIKERV